jgi:hypothetical protein
MLKHPHRAGFEAAAMKEYRDLESRKTFGHVLKTLAIKTLPLKWVFTYKFDTDGYLVKYKARICVRGDLQQQSKYQDNYAATLAARTFRALMAIAAAFDLEIIQLDAINAFTNSELDETTYCECPEGFERRGQCLLLLRALYGLKQSPKLWLNELSKTLRELGLFPVEGVSCLFRNEKLIVFFYVDDIVILCRTADLPDLHRFQDALIDRYEMRVLGELSWFLGIRIIRDRSQRKIWLCQDSYIEKIAKSFHLEDRKSPSTPMATVDLKPYEEQATAQEIYAYQRKVGSLLYAAIITRPDVANAAGKLSQYLTNPSPQHHGAVDRAISYLYGTRSLAIEYAGSSDQETLICASDAAFADDPTTRYSTEGYLFQLYGGAIDWRSAKQKTVTTSSTEAELLALSDTAKETYWWNRFFRSIKFDLDTQLTVQCDNLQTIRLLTKEDPHLATKLRHVDIHKHWLRQEVQAGRVNIEWVPTADMPADGLTKSLPRQRHESFIKQLGLEDINIRIKK